ncbi:NUDIX hydrolase domain-like protein [Xylariomycetidae sp. FL0641]|nr:NUDIX hydrolase domain-like protein [Xylariomycetidae sp. FL0641]
MGPEKIAPSLSGFHVPPRAWLAAHSPHSTRLVAGAMVAAGGGGGGDRVLLLLLRRAADEYLPLRWEVPGGSCDAGDASVVAAACRELWEEAGMRASAVTDLVDADHEWTDAYGVWRKITFLVEVEVGDGKNAAEGDGEEKAEGAVEKGAAAGRPVVKLDPREHCDYAWATEEEVRAGVAAGGRALEWTGDRQKETVLTAFRLIKGRGKGTTGGGVLCT